MKFKVFPLLIVLVHSSLFSQFKDSTNKIFLKKMIFPVALAATGSFLIQKQFKEKQNSIYGKKFKNFDSNIDDYIQYAPSFAFLVASITKKEGRSDRLIKGFLSTTATNGGTWILKRVFKIERPDKSDFLSFPSGHTTNVFTGAAILNKEFGGRNNPIIGIIGYSAATATGVLRMTNNKHWLSDVIAGAAIGIGGTEVTYFLYPKVKKLFNSKNQNRVFMPYYDGKSSGFVSNFTF